MTDESLSRINPDHIRQADQYLTGELSPRIRAEILRIAHDEAWTYPEALNYVVELGLGMSRSLRAVRAAREPEETG